MAKFGRNKPCWCGSGKKYKKCHLIRESEPSYSADRMLAKFRSKATHKACMHPKVGLNVCSKKIVDAHTIQKSGPLKNISDEENHVYSFMLDSTGHQKLQRIGWQKASTFKGFCSKHDKEMFSCIEDKPFIGSKEQCFIAGYRAYAMEYFKKVKVLKGMPFMRDNIDRGMTSEEQREMQSTVSTMKSGFLKGVDDFKTTLDIFTEYFASSNYDGIKSASFYFTGDLSVVVSGCFAPDFSIDGQRLQSLSPGVKFVENIAVNTLLTEDGFVIVFTWPSSFIACKKFIDSLLEVDMSHIASRLLEIIFSYIENSYFSRSWFDSLTDVQANRLKAMALNSVQYGDAVRFSGDTYTDWILNRVEYS
ncbi:MAG: SEC-C domain-containing protein [Sedimenticola sp.]